ncbi:Gp41 (endogenous virus) [Propionibacterium phage PAS50]|uniref:Gp41 n=1 Tax=Propionibacterium phage PAS50 TaxID=504553 RepID=F4MIN1_9CAUD|nr:Gp41 [Propionibacterium phage PAS50]ACX30880.1 Gp41 [Propionibacterium phage PAS50]
MNKKTGYTIAGATAAIIAAASFLPAPDDNPPLASQPAPQATTANTEWTPKTVQQRKAEKKARQAAAVHSLQAEQPKAHRQAQPRGEETIKGLTMITAAHTCNRKAEQQAAAHGVNWNGNPDIDLQLHKIIGKDTFSIVYGATAKHPGASKLPVTVHCLVTGTEDHPQVTDLNINPQQ